MGEREREKEGKRERGSDRTENKGKYRRPSAVKNRSGCRREFHTGGSLHKATSCKTNQPA